MVFFPAVLERLAFASVLPAHQVVTDMVVPKGSILHEGKELAEPPEAWPILRSVSRMQKGAGVRKDLAKSVQWFRRAAELGYAPAQVRLGLASLTASERILTSSNQWSGSRGRQIKTMLVLNST
jgi:hypothetical protein